MQPMFEELLNRMKQPLQHDRGVKSDNSILLIYPPDRELDFREQLLDAFAPALEALGAPLKLLDTTGFMFRGLDEEDVESLQQDEFGNYRWMVQGLSQRVEISVQRQLADFAEEQPGVNVVVFGTVALHPLLRFGEVLRGLRDLDSRIAIAFPGEERGGKLHFMNQPDGGNYLAVKLFWK